MKKKIGVLLSMVMAGALLVGTCLTAFASTAVVTEDSIRVRSEASTSGSVVTNVEKGQSFEIQETVTGSDGNTWYKIKVGDSNGYVRGDLVRVEEPAAEPAAEDTTENTASSLAPTEGTPINEVTATVKGNAAVNIRSGAGTGYAKVASLDPGTSITLLSEATDDAGSKWYQLRCDSKDVEGYIREDLITVNDPITPLEENPQEEEVPEEDMEVEEPIAAAPENNDYEIVYTPDDEGVYQYYLYNHVDSTRQKVVDLLSAVTELNDNYNEAQEQLSLFKILTGVFGALMLVFIILTVVFIIKNNSNSDGEYYEDDFEDDYEDEEDDYDDRRRPSKPAPRNERVLRPEPPRSASPSKSNIRPAREEAPQGRRPRKSQNFLADDDEFEFEFLNMDDKD